MTITYNTGKAELCFVKVPESKNGIEITIHGNERFLNVWGVEDIKLPSGNWQIVGNPFDLSEENLIPIVPQMKDSGFPFEVQEITDTWKELLDKWGIYQTNPLGEEPIRSNYSSWPEHLIDYGRWGYNQERTGSFILLKKIV